MIHSTAIIEKGAELGVNVSIGPFAYVAATARLGDGCVLYPHAVVLEHTTLGADCRVHSGAVIGDLPQDLSFEGKPSYVVTGDRCIFREGATVHRGTEPESTTRLGNDVFMMANSHIAHNDCVGDSVVLANCVLLAGHVTVGSNCFFGGGSAVHQFCRIGRYSMIAASAIITRNLPPFCITVTSMSSQVAGLNAVGLRRGGFTAAERAQIKAVFNVVYRQGLNVSQARAYLLKECADNPFAAEWAAFLADAKRGICNLASAKSGAAAADGNE